MLVIPATQEGEQRTEVQDKKLARSPPPAISWCHPSIMGSGGRRIMVGGQPQVENNDPI
jgi:hypothetical protein